MYYIKKRLEICGAHYLKLDYPSKCVNLHGHNWVITVYCKAKELNQNGMVVDFTHIKAAIVDKLDHTMLNEKFTFNPTAENIAHWIVQEIDTCYKAEVQENEGNIACYEEDDF